MKNKTNGVIFKARDFPPTSFVLFNDGRKWKRKAEQRRALYIQMATHGETEWKAVETLGKSCGFTERTTYRLLDDLQELGCVSDTIDDTGHKYHGQKRTRVRKISTDALAAPGS